MTNKPSQAGAKTGESLLKTLPQDVVMRARLLVSHLLLENGGIVLDMECGTGTLSAAMAALQPRLHFIGIDGNANKIKQASARYRQYDLPNLTFECGDITLARRPQNSVDAIINARVLGAVFTRSQYDEAPLQAMLRTHMGLLKDDGILLIYDYPMPDADEFVQIEFPVPERSGRHFRLYGTPIGTTQGEREIALLQWFANNAGAGGFYLEELPPHVPYTRLFKLPAKWAYEFMIRKQNIRAFKAKAGHQFAALSQADFNRILMRDIGARLLHTAPQYSQHIIRTHFEGAFRLYTAAGKPRGYMPTGHVVVAQKVASANALKLTELRPATNAVNSLDIQTVREEDTGTLIDMVARHTPTVDIIPFMRTAGGDVRVLMQAGVHRPLANTIPRGGASLDGKYWSGHMVAALSLPQEDVPRASRDNANFAAKIMQKHFGLQARGGFIKGLSGYTSPEMIDELAECLFVEIAPPSNTDKGYKIYDARDVLRACASGLIPNGWLDIQLQTLMQHEGIEVTPWLHEAVALSCDPPPADQLLRAGKILRQKPPNDKAVTPEPLVINAKRWLKTAGKFRPIRGRAGQIAALRSSFAEHDNKGRTLRAAEYDFACPQGDMANIAAVLPLTEDHQGNTLVGFEFKELPVPSRFGQTEAMINMPTLPLPASVTNMDEARAYIAEQFGVEVARVAPMGESFFTQIDMVTQRIFPFCLTRYPRRRTMKMRYTTLECLRDLIDPDFADSFLWYWGMAYARLCLDTQHQYSWAPRKEAQLRKTTQSVKRVDAWVKPADNTPSKAAPLPYKQKHG